MSQVVSRNLGDHRSSASDTKFAGIRSDWREMMRTAFHGAAASTFGYAICWQNVSEASAQLVARTNPLMRVYGKWRFLTYNCLMMQFVAYSLCFTAQFFPRLRRSRDYFFTTFAFPIGLLVVGSFWAIWFIAGREFILPASIEPYYPPWLNHITHTIIAPINLVELLISRKQFSDKKSIIGLTGYTVTYSSFVLYIRLQTGRFVYPFLNKMDAVPVGLFIVGMIGCAVLLFKAGKCVHDLVHKTQAIKSGKSSSGKSSKKKN